MVYYVTITKGTDNPVNRKKGNGNDKRNDHFKRKRKTYGRRQVKRNRPVRYSRDQR